MCRLGDGRRTQKCPHRAGTSREVDSAPLADLVPSHLEKHIKKTLILTFMAESALLPQIRKGPGNSTGFGSSEAREESKGGPIGTREDTLHVAGPCEAKQGFKVLCLKTRNFIERRPTPPPDLETQKTQLPKQVGP